MKRISVLLSVLFICGTVTMAQGGKQKGHKNMDPEKRAECATECMAKEFSLNEKQKEQVYEVNLEMFKKMASFRDNCQGKKEVKCSKKDRKEKGCNLSAEEKGKKRVDMKAERDARNAKLEKIFTKEQYAAYTQKQAERDQCVKNKAGKPRKANCTKANSCPKADNCPQKGK